MATLVDILERKYPGVSFQFTDPDDYEGLLWKAGNAIAKPPEAEIRAFSAEVDAAMAQALREERQEQALYDTRDAVVKALKILADAVADLQGRVAGATTQNKNRVAALQAKIAQIQSIT
jgi:hypothetical protein